MANQPYISVITPVFNGERYIEKSIESILSQSYDDFEYLIIDDSSNDSTPKILEKYLNYSKIRIITNHHNIGLTKSLNIGLKNAAGKYIARQDHDDISLRNRLKIQKEFLDSHKNVGVIGTSNHYINAKDKILYTANRESSGIINRWRLLFSNPIMHSSVMFRKDLVISAGGYDETYKRSQDYKLWSRLIETSDIVQLPDVLIKYRKHDESVSYIDTDEQINNSISIAKTNIENLLQRPINTELVEIIRMKLDRNPNKYELTETLKLIRKLISRFNDKNRLDISDNYKIHKHAAQMMCKINTTYNPTIYEKMMIIIDIFIVKLKYCRLVFKTKLIEK